MFIVDLHIYILGSTLELLTHNELGPINLDKCIDDCFGEVLDANPRPLSDMLPNNPNC